jgi:exosortase A
MYARSKATDLTKSALPDSSESNVLRSSNSAAVTRPTTRHSTSPTLLALLLSLAVLLFVFYPSWHALVKVWEASETYGHGFLIAPISLWLIWRKRDQLRDSAIKASWSGLLAVAVCCFAWIVGVLAGVNVLIYAAIVGMVVSTVIAVAGWDFASKIAFPLGFLFFMVPAGDPINPLLMEYTARMTIWAVRATGIPVFREGLNFTLPTGSWSVVEACSGLRYVVAAAVLGSLFAYLNFSSWIRRAVFFAAALVVAVIANWMRAYLIVMVGHLSNMRWGVGDDHVVYGWVFFGLTMFILFAMGSRWHDETRVVTSGPDKTTTGSGLEPRHFGNGSPGFDLRALYVLLPLIALLALTPSLVQELQRVAVKTDVFASLNKKFNQLDASGLTLQPKFDGARSTLQGGLSDAARTEVFIAYFADQRDGNEMIAYGNGVFTESDRSWKILNRTDRTVSVNGNDFRVREWQVSNNTQQRLVWSWFTIGDHRVSSEYQAKALTAWMSLIGKGDHSAVSVISTIVAAGPSGTPDANSEKNLMDARSRLESVNRSILEELNLFNR